MSTKSFLCRDAAAVLLSATACMSFTGNALAQSGNVRVDALLAKMTLEEKISLIHGALEPAAEDQGQAGYWAGLPKYGIPPLRLADGPPGVLTRLPSTALPATMALAATFSRANAEQNGAAIGRSAKALGQQIMLQPYINIHRDQTFNRAYNTYGEDPLLTGEIGAAIVKGIQAQGIMAQAKHYIGYDGGTDVIVNPQALREIYLAPFKSAIDARVSSLMCSYNKINGPYACGSEPLLVDILRSEMGFKGFITSDWGAVHGGDFVARGLDMEMPGTALITSYFSPLPPQALNRPPPVFTMSGRLPEEPAPPSRERAIRETSTGLLDLLQKGVVKEKDIDRAAGHILYEVERFGWLDKPPSRALSAEPVEANAKIGLKTAREAAVLLKNDGILPLNPDDLKALALIGPGAGQLIAVGQVGEKALGHVARQISPLNALRAAAGPDGNAIVYVAANDMDGTAIPASFFSHDAAGEMKTGLVRTDGESGTPVEEAQIDHTIRSGSPLPKGGLHNWKGILNIPASGRYRLHLQVIGGSANLSIDGKPAASTATLIIHGNVLQPGQDNVVPTTDGLDNVRIEQELTAGPHPITLNVTGDDSGSPVQVRLAWVTPEQQQANYASAIQAAKNAKTVLVFAWGRDRPNFSLPGIQDKLIEDIAAVNPNIVVVLNVSQPIAMPWLDKVKAVLQMWYPGDEGGWATADVLTGKINPAGRLPFTWPVRLEDNVANDPAHPERSSAEIDAKTNYSEGIFVGYRWFDSQNIAPLFPFGFGLSYTRFAYSGLKATPGAKGAMDVSFTVRNTGNRAGDEVAQAYLGAPQNSASPDAQFAVRALAGFERIYLEPGESRTVRMILPARRFEYWSERDKGWLRTKGLRQLSVGTSSRDLRQTVSVNP